MLPSSGGRLPLSWLLESDSEIQVGQIPQFRWNAPADLVILQQQIGKARQVAQLRWQWQVELVVPEIKRRQIAQCANLVRDRSRDLVVRHPDLL